MKTRTQFRAEHAPAPHLSRWVMLLGLLASLSLCWVLGDLCLSTFHSLVGVQREMGQVAREDELAFVGASPETSESLRPAVIEYLNDRVPGWSRNFMLANTLR